MMKEFRQDNGDAGDAKHDKTKHVEVDSDLSDSAPDGGWGWFVTLGCLLVHFIVGGFERSGGVLYVHLEPYYGQSATATSWAVSCANSLRLLLGPLASALCQRFSVRTVVALGASLSSGGVLLSAFSPNITYFFLSYGIIVGVGRALTYGPSLILVGQYFNKRRSLAVGIATSGAAFSSCVFPFLFEHLFTHYGFSGTFWILGAITSHLYICAALARPIELHQRIVQQGRLITKNIEMKSLPRDGDRPTGNSDEPDTVTDTLIPDNPDKQTSAKTSYIKQKFKELRSCVSGEKQTESKTSLLEVCLLRNVAFLCMCLQLFLITMSRNIVYIYLPALALEKGIDTFHSAYILAVMSVFDFLTRIVGAPLWDLERLRRYRPIIYNGVIFFMGVVSLAIPFLRTFSQLYIAAGLYGVSCALYFPQNFVVCTDILGVEHLTSALGLLLAFCGAGSIGSPTVGGLVKDIQGSYMAAFYVGAVGTFVGGAVMVAGNVWLYQRDRFTGSYRLLARARCLQCWRKDDTLAW